MFWNARARNTHVEATLNRPFAAQASIKRHAFFHKVDPSEFAWAPLAACDAAALPPPHAPPAAANPLAPTNFTPDADVEGYDDTVYAGAQEVFERWSELHDEHGTLFDASDLHMAK